MTESPAQSSAMRRAESWLRAVPGRRAGLATALAAALALPIMGVTAAAAVGRQPDRPMAAQAVGPPFLAGWGVNGAGQLGDGTVDSRLVPVPVKLPAGTTVTQIRGGCRHTLALTTKGHVLAWGDNTSGQLGDGSTNASLAPVRVQIPAHIKIITVRADCTNSLALTSHGRVLAWGDNTFGELGNGGSIASAVPVRVKLPATTKVPAISAGMNFGVALTTKGRLFAWGLDAQGELGNGGQHQLSATPVKVRLPRRTKVRAVAAGGDHTLALTSKGHLLAWGLNNDGQLGDGTTGNRHTPARISLPGGTKVTAVVGGAQHSLARTSRGRMLAWGDNEFGQLGDGLTANQLRPVPVKLPSGTKVTTISAGIFYSLVLTTKHHVLAWGFNQDGQLGDDSTVNRLTPVRVVPAALTATVIGVGPAALTSFAIVREPAAGPRL